MIVKRIIGEELLTLAEVRAVLEEVRQKRADEPEELGYELRRALRHAELFAPPAPESTIKIRDELLNLEKMSPEIATKIADCRPQTKDELRAIYAKERFTLSEDELDVILDIVFRG